MNRQERESRRSRKREKNRRKKAEAELASSKVHTPISISDVPPYELVSSPAHYGNGVVLCETGGCKEHTWMFVGRMFKGYDLPELTPAMIYELQVMAALHLQEHPKHPVRIIVFQQGTPTSGEISVHAPN